MYDAGWKCAACFGIHSDTQTVLTCLDRYIVCSLADTFGRVASHLRHRYVWYWPEFLRGAFLTCSVLARVCVGGTPARLKQTQQCRFFGGLPVLAWFC